MESGSSGPLAKEPQVVKLADSISWGWSNEYDKSCQLVTDIWKFGATSILLIASINFMNLATARASKRAREVALRKVMGATRLQIAMQFLGEAVVITILALFCALVAVELTLPLYNDVIDRELAFEITEDLTLLLGLLVVAVSVGLISGSYPAVYLSRFPPMRILKASPTGEGSGQGSIRALLVVFQFAASTGLAVCTLVIFAQTQYARNMDVGYRYDSKLVLSGLNSAGALDQRDAIVNELSAIAGVKSVVLSSEVPSQDNENNTGFQLLDGANEGLSDAIIINYYTTGFGFFEAYDMKILAGRFFDKRFGTDEIQAIEDDEERIGNASIVVNESAMRALGFGSCGSRITMSVDFIEKFAVIGHPGVYDSHPSLSVFVTHFNLSIAAVVAVGSRCLAPSDRRVSITKATAPY